MKRLILGLVALGLASSAAAQNYTVPTTTTIVPSLECLLETQNDFKSAWQQTSGNPYYDTYEDSSKPKNGVADSLEGSFYFMAAARGCTYRKAAGLPTSQGPTYADGYAAAKAKAIAAANGL